MVRQRHMVTGLRLPQARHSLIVFLSSFVSAVGPRAAGWTARTLGTCVQWCPANGRAPRRRTDGERHTRRCSSQGFRSSSSSATAFLEFATTPARTPVVPTNQREGSPHGVELPATPSLVEHPAAPVVPDRPLTGRTTGVGRHLVAWHVVAGAGLGGRRPGGHRLQVTRELDNALAGRERPPQVRPAGASDHGWPFDPGMQDRTANPSS